MGNIIISNSNVVVNNEFKSRRANRLYNIRRWRRCFKVGHLRIYVTWNWRLKTRNKRDVINNTLNIRKHRQNVYNRAGGKCELCGSSIGMKDMQLHHVLPILTFKKYASNERNMMCLCGKCHRMIHNNPFKNCKMQEMKAEEFGIIISDYYENESMYEMQG